jgi:signal transduction histidine kinase/CheY-like chemotaxis protein/amino acid transporter
MLNGAVSSRGAQASSEATPDRLIHDAVGPGRHPRTIGWLGTTALALGGSNQSLFLIAALFVGQGAIPGQGSAAVPLLILGLLLSWAAAPGWTELILMWPNRVGGIAATCSEAFRSYAPVLSALAGSCYWWGWVPTCGLTAILSASAIHGWLLPSIPINVLAIAIIAVFVAINLRGIKLVVGFALPIAVTSAVLAFLSVFVPIATGHVDWHQATTFHLTTPFAGWFGKLTSLMAGLYLIGFAAPAFEAAACHVGETIDPARNVPRAMFASAGIAGFYFIVIPVVWLGVLGPESLGRDLSEVLGPTFAPMFGASAKALAIGFVVFNMFHGTLQPLAGASRTLSQLADDGVFPRVFGLRLKGTDAPWVATLITAAAAIVLLLIGDPIWLIAAANFTYLIGICLPSVAVWLLRRDAPQAKRLYRAPRGFIWLGLCAAVVWGLSAILGFEQFGLPTVILGLVFAYAGAVLFAWRKFEDRRQAGFRGIPGSLHLKLTGAMVAVLLFDGAGYLIAVGSLPHGNGPMFAALQDIFVAVAMLTISVGLVLPGMIAHAATEVSSGARKLVSGIVADFTRAMDALGRGDLDAAHADVNISLVAVRSHDELGEMTASFNVLQEEIRRASLGLGGAREGLRAARSELIDANSQLNERINERTQLIHELTGAKEAAEAASIAKSQFLAKMSHEIRTPMNGVLSTADLLLTSDLSDRQRRLAGIIQRSGGHLLDIIDQILDLSKLEAGKLELERIDFNLCEVIDETVDTFAQLAAAKRLELHAKMPHTGYCYITGDPVRLRRLLSNLLSNAIKFTEHGAVSVEVSFLEEKPSGGFDLEISVHDTGVGIAPGYRDRLFESFSQADGATTRKYGGTGLGLAIVKQIVDLVGGRISVESQVGKGSHFCVRLPFQRASSRQTTICARLRRLGNLRCLLVDSNSVACDDLRDQLEQWHVAVTAVADGAAALERLSADDGYDVAIIASRLDDVDALELIERIRHSGSTSDPAIVVKASVHELRDESAMKRLRLSDWLCEPMRESDLYNTLAVIARNLETRSHVPQEVENVLTHSGQIGYRRILLAEDNLVNQEVTAESLRYIGYDLDIVDNGAAAVAAFESTEYALILMDCHMPKMDGYEATQAIRRIEQGRASRARIPIIALSANAMKGDKDHCLACGMDDHLAKPFELAGLRGMLERWLRLSPSYKHTAADPPAGSHDGTLERGSAEHGTLQYETEVPIIDWSALERIAQLQRPGRASVLAKVVRAFSESTPVLLDALETALAENNFDGIRERAHGLKSSSANVGAANLSRMFRELECTAGEQNCERAWALLKKVRHEYRSVHDRLAAYLTTRGLTTDNG